MVRLRVEEGDFRAFHWRADQGRVAAANLRNHLSSFKEHDVAVFVSLGLHDADDVLRAVDIANPEPDHLARAQPCDT
jgi:hypothetical protein